MEQFWQIFWSVLGTAATVLVTWLTKKLTDWLNEKITDKKYARYSVDIAHIIMSAVNQINQTYVSTLKNEGKFDKEAQSVALHNCKQIVESQLTPELREYISTNFGDISTFITSQIESWILRTK